MRTNALFVTIFLFTFFQVFTKAQSATISPTFDSKQYEKFLSEMKAKGIHTGNICFRTGVWFFEKL